jgi:glycosyltransferase involved in cell wall biosynthesis
VVLPNMVDPFDWDTPKRNRGKKVRIGLIGSVGYDDYKVIEPYLLELSKRDDVQLVMFSLTKPEYCNDKVKDLYKDSYQFVKNNIEWHTHVRMAQYMDKINSLELDLALIPRRETYFNKCKSNLKFLELSMLEIPVIASSFSDGNSPYDKDIDGKNGILASTDQEWREATELLIKDKELRRKMGKEARKYTLKHYNIENNYQLWADAYKTIL